MLQVKCVETKKGFTLKQGSHFILGQLFFKYTSLDIKKSVLVCDLVLHDSSGISFTFGLTQYIAKHCWHPYYWEIKLKADIYCDIMWANFNELDVF